MNKAKKRCKATYPIPSQAQRMDGPIERQCRKKRVDGKDFCRSCLKIKQS